jgi:hypothetical protein
MPPLGPTKIDFHHEKATAVTSVEVASPGKRATGIADGRLRVTGCPKTLAGLWRYFYTLPRLANSPIPRNLTQDSPMNIVRPLTAFACVMLLGVNSLVQAQAAETPQQRVANLKAWLQASKEQMRAYQWIETTTVSIDGEQKSRLVQRCYYDVEGNLEKVPVEHTQASEGASGVFGVIGAIKEHKKEEVEDYIKSARKLVHDYIPPSPEKIQLATSSGYMNLRVLEPGHKVELSFANYLKQGDSLAAQIALPTNQLLGISIDSYLGDDTQDAITLNASMSVLPDGTLYVKEVLLDGKARKLTISVENSGYQHTAK